MGDCPHYISANVVQSVQGRFIYKDECVKCFTNQDYEEGVNLCLTCLVGGCDHHSAEHKKQKDHPIYLNFKRVPKPIKEEDKKPKEITKLAIGVAGGADFDEQKQKETKTEVRCLECNKTLDPTKFQGIINSIINAESASLKNEISVWENEVKSCAHVQTMVQTEKKDLGNKSLATCSACELSSNLWLCLFCGYLGCGRPVHGGKGGNGHAKKHAEETGHTVVVKLGTITPDGSASVHCYGCDDEILDDKLADHLGNFGIKIDRLEKTEKSIAELNLQINLNLTLTSVIEEGRKITPVFGSGLTGMQNLGNSCYMNSVLQVLFSIDEFRERYYDEGVKHLEKCTSFTPECFVCQFSKIGFGVFSGKYSERKEAEPVQIEGQEPSTVKEVYQDGIRPYMFKMLVGKGHVEFSTNRQQDAYEYFRHLLSFIQKAEKKEKLADITKLFEFNLTSKLVCQGCGGYKENGTQTQAFPFFIPKTEKFKTEVNDKKEEEQIPIVDFTDCLKFLGGEIVEIECPQCKKTTPFKKTSHFKTWPKYLVMPVMRIMQDADWVIKKNNTEIVFNPETVDFSSFRYTEAGPNDVKLGDEVVDEGPKIDQGALDTLLMMGFGENRAKRGLLQNNNDPEAAANWLFEKIDDPSLDEPLEKPKKKTEATPSYSIEVIEFIKAMGFSEKEAFYALKQCDGNGERAVDYLFNHPEVADLIKESEQGSSSTTEKNPFDQSLTHLKDPLYDLKGVIVHLGRNYQSGHYVAYVKKDDKWIYFNDAKVAETDNPAIGKGSVFLFQRNDENKEN